jgi:hypothetical protein
MTGDMLGALAAALADRYHIQRELGQGGMSEPLTSRSRARLTR